MIKATQVHINAKCSDLCHTALYSESGELVAEKSDYVAPFFPGGGGDYVELQIDMRTGKILNWIPPEEWAVEDFISTCERNP